MGVFGECLFPIHLINHKSGPKYIHTYKEEEIINIFFVKSTLFASCDCVDCENNFARFNRKISDQNIEL